MSDKELVIGAKTPPLTWFTGFGDAQNGIVAVLTSREFLSLKDGSVGTEYLKWATVDLPILNPNNTGPTLTDQEKQIIKKEAADYVVAQTGFSPQQIQGYAKQLQKAYGGKTNAPFKLRLAE